MADDTYWFAARNAFTIELEERIAGREGIGKLDETVAGRHTETHKQGVNVATRWPKQVSTR